MFFLGGQDTAMAKISLASDHAGVDLKARISAHLEQSGHEVMDLGPFSEDSVDYPDFGHALARSVSSGQADKGIAICGSGIGISIAVNRHKGVRAALVHNSELAALSRQHNDANVLALGARFTDEPTALQCVDSFLNTDFEGDRHKRRVDKLDSDA